MRSMTTTFRSIHSESTASGRVTRRASSDPACIFPHFAIHHRNRSEEAPSEGKAADECGTNSRVGLDRRQLRPGVPVVESRALRPSGCWYEEHLIRFRMRVRSHDSAVPTDDGEPRLGPALRELDLGELRVHLDPGWLDGFDLP